MPVTRLHSTALVALFIAVLASSCTNEEEPTDAGSPASLDSGTGTPTDSGPGVLPTDAGGGDAGGGVDAGEGMGCACDVDFDCTMGCACDPECCTCDTTAGCEAGCACDPDCGACACDLAAGSCSPQCDCDPDCGGDSACTLGLQALCPELGAGTPPQCCGRGLACTCPPDTVICDVTRCRGLQGTECDASSDCDRGMLCVAGVCTP